MMVSNTLLRQQRREMGLWEYGSDLLSDGLCIIRDHALFQVIAVDDADVNHVLENDRKFVQKIAYDFVDVVLATGFPWVNFPVSLRRT